MDNKALEEKMAQKMRWIFAIDWALTGLLALAVPYFIFIEPHYTYAAISAVGCIANVVIIRTKLSVKLGVRLARLVIDKKGAKR